MRSLLDFLPFRTKIEIDDKEVKQEQKALLPDKEPDTQIVDIAGTVNYLSLYNETFTGVNELISTYREMAGNFEISEALDEIENEAIIVEDDESISLNTDKIELSPAIQKKISEEFKNVLKILNWDEKCYDLFRQWFIDGRLYQQKVMHSNVKQGLKKIVTLDPKKLIRMKKKDSGEIYYQYNYNEEETYTLNKDAITFTPSGLVDASNSYYISELHKSIRPLNNLRLMEDSALIYYITRAPSKRAFYIDVGNSPTGKGEEKVKKIMQKFQQRISYDSTTGKITQQKKSIPVNEDFWFATRGDTRGTKVETIQGDTNLLDPEILAYYKKKLYKSLAVPFARVDEDLGSTMNFENPSEMSRQEIKLAKQTSKRRKRFSKMFSDLLKTQLIAKQIVTIADWDEKIKTNLYYEWKNDSYFLMIKQTEILTKKIELANELTPFVGKFFSNAYLRKQVFNQTDSDIEQMDEEIEEEEKSGKYKKEVDIEPTE